MNQNLQLETEKLTRSWMRQDAAVLRDYLVADVEDPRLNQQSLLTRHFLARAATGHTWIELMAEETRFAAALGWLQGPGGPHSPEEADAVGHALRVGADNAEGLELPSFLQPLYASLPRRLGPWTIPNYVAGWLAEAGATGAQAPPAISSRDTFLELWRSALAPALSTPAEPGAATTQRPSVLEPACGSANDYRFLEAYGLAQRLDYTGFDLCPTNVANARTLFPNSRFESGNVFAIAAPDAAFDLCFVHDLFEHLSLEGLAAAIDEICRVTRHGLCLHCFNMEEIREHRVQPVEEYHWNTLSMGRLRQAFAARGFTGRVLHIGTYLEQLLGWSGTHNPRAYTLELYRE